MITNTASLRFAGSIGLALCVVISTASAQQSRQLFETPSVVLPAGQTYDVLLDLDGDGFADALESRFHDDGGGSGHQQIRAHHNDGSGALAPGFVFEWSAATGISGTGVRIAAANFNGDTKRDFVVLAGFKLGCFLSNGVLPPTLLATIDVPSALSELTTGDFDGNGVDDVAIRSTENGTWLHVFHRVTTATPGANLAVSVPAALLASEMNRSLAALDITGDGIPELLAVGLEFIQTTVSVVRAFAVAGPTLAAVGNWNLSNTGFEYPVIVPGDVDGDGDTDLVAYFSTHKYQVMKLSAPATFVLDPLRLGPIAHELVDLDGDGDVDSVGVDLFSPFNPSASLEIAFNDGTGNFGFGATWLCATPRNFAGVSDLEHDGDLDFVAGRNVFYARGPWTDAAPAFVSPPGYPSVDATRFLDLDGDGDLDAYSHRDSYLRNRGDGTFEVTSRITPQLPLNTHFTTAGFSGDVDGDGDIDLVVHHLQNGLSTAISERLLLNNGAGGLTDGGAITDAGVLFDPMPTVENPLETAVTFIDADNDGDQDAIASHEDIFGSFTEVYSNNGGHFTSSQKFSDGATNSDRIADIDGDGFPDIVTARNDQSGSVAVKVRWGSASGYSAPKIVASAFDSNYVTDLFIADLDEDGDPDLVYGFGLFSQYVYWVEYLGSRQFALHTGLVTPFMMTYPSHLRVADVDHDSHVDLVLANDQEFKSTSIFFGSGAPGADFTQSDTSYWMSSLAFADVDGDGDVDSLGAMGRIRNLRYVGAEHGRHVQFGAPTAGGFGQTPVLGASGELRVGQVAQTLVRGTAPGAIGMIFVGATKAVNPPLVLGGSFYVFPFAFAATLPFPGNPTESGSGGIALPYVVPPGVAGVKWYEQVAAYDAANPHGVIWTNALELEFGP